MRIIHTTLKLIDGTVFLINELMCTKLGFRKSRHGQNDMYIKHCPAYLFLELLLVGCFYVSGVRVIDFQKLFLDQCYF